MFRGAPLAVSDKDVVFRKLAFGQHGGFIPRQCHGVKFGAAVKLPFRNNALHSHSHLRKLFIETESVAAELNRHGDIQRLQFAVVKRQISDIFKRGILGNGQLRNSARGKRLIAYYFHRRRKSYRVQRLRIIKCVCGYFLRPIFYGERCKRGNVCKHIFPVSHSACDDRGRKERTFKRSCAHLFYGGRNGHLSQRSSRKGIYADFQQSFGQGYGC